MPTYIHHIALAMLLITNLSGIDILQNQEPQEPARVRIVTVDQSRFPDVKVAVSSTNSNGDPVRPSPTYTVTVADTPVEFTSETRRVPVAVSVVADLSQRMSDTGTTRFTQRFLDMKPLIGNLLSVLQALPDQRASLITFNQQVEVSHPLTHDLGEVGNTVGQTGAQPFLPDPLPDSPVQQPYPLGEAIAEGLRQLEGAPPEAQLVLAVFAAGDPAQQVAAAALRQQIDDLAAQGRPVRVVVFSFGSDQPGSWSIFPADPAGLKALAQEIGGTFIAIGEQPLQPAQKQEITQQFERILDLGLLDVLRFDASALPSGAATLRVAAGAVADTFEVNFSQLPPRATVVIDPPSFQGKVRLSIAVQSQQAAIREVSYLLDNLMLAAAPQTSGPAFALEIDTFASDFQRRFPPGQHQLSAAVKDENGQETRIEPVAVVVVAPPERTLPEQLAAFWWAPVLLIAVGAVAGVVVVYQKRRKSTAPGARPGPAAGRAESSDAIPAHHPISEPPTERLQVDEGETLRVSANQEDLTEHIGRNLATRRLFTWAVEITGENGIRRLERLPHDKRYIEIGRNGSASIPDIAFDDQKVSRTHARLQYNPNQDRIDLYVGESANGTFFGEEQRRLEVNTTHELREGDVFWVTRSYKLRLIRES